jgi:hypothetical protein
MNVVLLGSHWSELMSSPTYSVARLAPGSSLQVEKGWSTVQYSTVPKVNLAGIKNVREGGVLIFQF